jgi:uncharacterized protein
MVTNEHTPDSNKALVRASFDRWESGTGSPFELLDPETKWTIVGWSPLSKTCPSRQAFLDEVIGPFNARMATPLVPTVRGIYADGDMVIILFDAAAMTKDGQPITTLTPGISRWQKERRKTLSPSSIHGNSTSSGRVCLRQRDPATADVQPVRRERSS